jgi:hypothetical protein
MEPIDVSCGIGNGGTEELEKATRSAPVISDNLASPGPSKPAQVRDDDLSLMWFP